VVPTFPNQQASLRKMSQNMRTRLARNGIASAIAGLAVMLGGFLSSVLIARLLGVEATGIVAYATWAITLSVVVVDLGTSGTLARFLPELRARGEQTQAGALIRFLFGVTAMLLCIVCTGFFGYAAYIWWRGNGLAGMQPGHYDSDPLFWVLIGLACLLQTAGNFANAHMKGSERFERMARLAGFSAMLQISVVAAGAWSWGANGALIGSLAVGLLPTLLLPGMLEKPGSLSPELRRRVTRYTLQTWVSYLGSVFAWSRMELFFLERSWGSQSVALFSVGLTLANLASQGPLLLTGGLLPYLSEKAGVNANHKVEEAYAFGLRGLALLVFPACFGLAAIAPTLLPTIYGNAFADAVPSATVLVAGASFAATSSVATTYLLAMERTRFVLFTGTISAALAVAAGLAVVPLLGTMGAAVSRVVIQLSVVALTIWYIARRLRCPTPFSSLARIVLCAATSGVCAWALTRFIPGIPGLSVAIPAAAITYGIAIRLLQVLPRSDVDRLLDGLSILPPLVRVPAGAMLRLMSASPERASVRSTRP
jgi:O-antigen/teichoic acid export membrane protein